MIEFQHWNQKGKYCVLTVQYESNNLFVPSTNDNDQPVRDFDGDRYCLVQIDDNHYCQIKK